jgi:hypothetical protein
MCSLAVETTGTGGGASGLADGRASGLAALAVERLEGEITELAAHISAATCRWLLLVGEFDRRGGWLGWGCRSCAQWLSYRCGLSPGAGREHVRVARRLAGLPAIRAAFGRGELCYSQVRALTRVATAETEAGLVMVARHATAAQLDVIVAAYRGVVGHALGGGGGRRYLRCAHDDDGSLLIRARLPAEEGALVVAALEAARDALRAGGAPGPSDGRDTGAGPGTGCDPAAAAAPGGGAPAEATHSGDDRPVAAAGGGGAPAEATHSGDDRPVAAAVGGGAPAEATHSGDIRPAAAAGGGGAAAEATDGGDGELAPGERPAVSSADALVLMAQTLLAAGPADGGPADGYQVVVHVDAATLADHDRDHDRDHGRDTDGGGGGGGPCELERGTALHPDAARRLACDASLVRILERDGRPLSVGRKTRSVAPALRRALKSRDRGCRFPGCGQRRFLHAHHIDHWADGGPTDLSNLVQLCSHHHRLVHEGGYRIERGPHGAPRFRRPDGRPVPAVPRAPRATRTGWKAATANTTSTSPPPPASPASTPTGSTCTGSSTTSPKPTAA